ncbi:MAG TPA: type I phosphomannose isomerase catalytic subunit [Cytophagaceae bacterium]|jgi:mannose-6-phosphate isomerase|nr:type I phosphomannose isomerase catalytic subunit [Cytophagaceae bacterium]
MYPLLFTTLFKDKIWGGEKIKTILGKDFSPLPNCGETWEISGVKGNVSVVREGAFSGKDLASLIEEFKGQLVGERVYAQFGNEFPLLIKFIDANDDLSIQVHPDDELARERHDSFGKTEMWYVLQADKGAKLNAGFSKPIDEAIYLKHLQNNTLEEILNFETVEAGDVFFLPAGRVHYIGKGVCLAEIQQTSDVTYRIYDFDRTDHTGNKRELHTDHALAAIDYHYYGEYKTNYSRKMNEPTHLVECPYFTTHLLELDKVLERDYQTLDSFVIYICTEGEVIINYHKGSMKIKKGDSMLLPAVLKSVSLTPSVYSTLLEVYITPA